MAKNKGMFKLAATLLSAGLLFACSNETADNQASETATADPVIAEEMTALVNEAVAYGEADEYTDWEDENPFEVELNGTDADFASTSAIIYEDNVLTIKAGGTYVFTGSLDNGQIVVDSEDKKTVRLVLNGVEINSSDSSAIYVKDAEKAVISLVEDTENSISDGTEYVFEDSSEDEPDAAIFSKADLTINGSGKLAVTGNYNDGIASKDELKVTGGNIQVTAADDGLKGRDIVAIKAGTFAIEAGGDGIKSTNDEDATKGTIALEGGTFDITSGNDGIQAETSLLITDGAYTIAAGGGSPETIEAAAGDVMPGTPQEAPVETAEEETESTKGIKAGSAIEVSGGVFAIDSLDDAVHSNGDVAIAGGQWDMATGDDGVHADASLVIKDGLLAVTKSNEGIEGDQITIDGGTIDVTAADDGINVSGGAAMAPGAEQEAEETTETTKTEQDLETLLTINGGSVTVDASGDGIDSNGSIEMTGGTVLVNGPTENMNGSLDYDVDFNVTGGLLITAGSSGMLQAANEESTQASVVMMYPETQEAGTIVHLQDNEGKTIATFAPSKDYQAVLISSPDLAVDSSYTFSSGGTSTAEQTNGLYTDGGYGGGTKLLDFTITEQVTWLDENGVAEAGSSGAGGFGGTAPEAGSRPPEGAEGGAGMPPGAGMDEEMKEKMEAIMEKQKNGAITQQEAQKQMAELGIEMPEGR